MAPLRLRRGQGAMQRNPCYARLFADLPHTPQGAFSCPFGTIHLVSPNPIQISGGRVEHCQWQMKRGGGPVSKGAPGRPHRPTQRDHCKLRCGPRTPQRFFDSLKALSLQGFFIWAVCWKQGALAGRGAGGGGAAAAPQRPRGAAGPPGEWAAPARRPPGPGPQAQRGELAYVRYSLATS